MAAEAQSQLLSSIEKEDERGEKRTTIIIGLSGPSSSGKTTLARLLRTIFGLFGAFILHEDDFYYPDDKIPVTTTSSGQLIQDWDTIGAIDLPCLSSALSYVRQHGALPPRLKSKEDQNEATDSGVNAARVERWRTKVGERVSEQGSGRQRLGRGGDPTLVFLEGFLLYAPPAAEDPDHILRPIHNQIDLHLFLPAPYNLVKSRREARSGYMTIGPAPTPSRKPDGDDADEKSKWETADLEKGNDGDLPRNFWTDPPGYVDDIVWPRYVEDHAWLLLPQDEVKEVESRGGECGQPQARKALPIDELLKIVGQGANVRTDAGVFVAPGHGMRPMTEILDWAVKEILKYLALERE
ncbi:P-loop containing nucleoside triphosphate hydrolase protein [Elaphomyces granulatus]